MTTYYVDATSGNDSNAGTSTGQAWQNISKINTEWNAGTFSAGDSILLRRGEQWDVSGGGLYPRNGSGTAISMIYVGAYGSGADPILDHGGVNGSCVYRNNGDSNADYIHFQNIRFTGAQQAAGMKIYDATGWRVEDCKIDTITRDSGAGSPWCAGIQLRWTTGVKILNCEFDDVAGEAIYGGESGVPATYCDDSLILGCTFNAIQDEIIDFKNGCDHNIVAFCSSTNSTTFGQREFNIGGNENLFFANDWDAIEEGAQMSTATVSGGDYAHYNLRCIFRNGDTFNLRLSAEDQHVFDCLHLDGADYGVVLNEWYSAGADHILRHNYFRGNGTAAVDQDTSRRDVDGSHYGGDCAWDQGGSIRDLSYVQGTLSQELHAQENVPVSSNYFIPDDFADTDDPAQVQTWHSGDHPVAVFAAQADFVDAVWWSELSGMNESEMNSELSDFSDNFAGLTVQMVSGSTTRIEATWE